MTHFDIAIIGSGSGNSIPDPRFDGKSIAIIEKGVYGGTCLNVGCIPTKMFVYAADIARAIDNSTRYGIDAHRDGVRWSDIVDRVFGRIDPISEGGLRYRRDQVPNTTVYTGVATLKGANSTGSHQISIALNAGGTQTITAEKVVIAAGSRPVVPDVIAQSEVRYYTNENIMRLSSLPKSIIIVGGGYIASEFAHVFASLGVDVTMIVRGEALLRHLDETITSRFTEVAKKQWTVKLSSNITKVTQQGEDIAVTLDSGEVVVASTLLVATGRRPNSDLVDAASAGLEVDSHGRIVVDQYQRTNVENIFALGDVSSHYQLKHVANHEERVTRHNLLVPFADTAAMVASNHDYVPAAVFTHPQIAEVGMTEAAARRELGDQNVTVKVQDFADVAYGWAMEDNVGFCKLIADRRTGKLVGAHIMGEQASTLIQTAVTGMQFGLSVHQLARGQYWIHPALTEVIENALLGLEV